MGSINIKNYIPNSKLSEKLWDGMKLKKDIRKKLLIIAEEFIDYLGISIDVIDITLTGSLANYNYTKFSDIDLHIMVDYDELTSTDDLAKEFFNAKKSFWNDRHDIEIKDIEVELYAQDVKEEHSSSGVYSLVKNEWIIKPKKFRTEVSIKDINNKYKKVKKEIDASIELAKRKKDEKYVEQRIEKIKKMRKSGLEKGGELSDENLVYKIIRDTGDLQKLHDLKLKLFDDNLSI